MTPWPLPSFHPKSIVYLSNIATPSRHVMRGSKCKLSTLRIITSNLQPIVLVLHVDKSTVIASRQVHPKERTGRPSTLSKEQVDQLEAFIRLFRRTRQMNHHELGHVHFESWHVGSHVMCGTLLSRGHSGRVGPVKSPLT